VARENALSYSVSANGPAGDWYWEVIASSLAVSPPQGYEPARTPRRPPHPTQNGSR
jgi:hypothetical protein